MTLAALASWCAALFLAATLFSHTVALRLLLLIAGIVLLAGEALRSRLQGREDTIRFAPPLAWPFALWAAWAAASFFWTLEPGLTSKEFRNEIVYAFGALWLCFCAAQARGAPRLIGAVTAAGALAVCAAALAEPAVARIRLLQLHGGPGAFSSTLLILYPCTLAAAWFAWRGGRRALALAALVLLPLYFVSGYATQNRTLWVGLAGQTVLIALLTLLRPGTARGTKTAIAATAALLVIGAGVVLAKVEAERTAGGSGAARDLRPELWQSALRKIDERPLAGAGFGRGMFRQELRAQAGTPQIWHSHNLFVDTAIQLGWPGLALLVLLFGWTAGLAWRLARSASDAAFACGLALLPLVAGTVVRNLTDVLWVRQSALLYWGAVGVLLAWGLRAQRAGR